MKNSDMKIIAIILSIALFFTIVTSNAVSIASVVFLAKGNTASSGSGNGNGDSGKEDSPASNDAQDKLTEGTEEVEEGDDNAIAVDPLAAFQAAAKDIVENGSAGYSKKSWQGISGQLKLSAFDFLSSTLTNLIAGFMTTEDQAEVKENAKGSDDAKRRMPLSNCSPDVVASATAAKKGDNYVVTIVMKDEVNPMKADTDGVKVMSGDILYIEDVRDTIENDPTVSKIVKSLDEGTINYKAYTITAEMTPEGQFVEIVHFCNADLKATVTVGPGQLTGEGGLTFNVHYFNFQY